MFSNLNFWEIGALVLLALFIFGPERLPKVISDGVRMLRGVRDMARNATSDLSRELGTEVRLEDLHPKTFIRKHLLSEDEEANLRRPFDDAIQEVRNIATDANDSLSTRPRTDVATSADRDSYPVRPDPATSYDRDNGFPAPPPAVDDRRYDADAT